MTLIKWAIDVSIEYSEETNAPATRPPEAILQWANVAPVSAPGESG